YVGVERRRPHPRPVTVELDEGVLDRVVGGVPVAAERVRQPSQRAVLGREVLHELRFPAGRAHATSSVAGTTSEPRRRFRHPASLTGGRDGASPRWAPGGLRRPWRDRRAW